MKNKKELRGRTRDISKTIASKDKEIFSKKIISQLANTELFKKANKVGVFHEKFLWEPSIYKVLKDNKFFGKDILLPKCKTDTFDYIGNFEKLGKGKFDTIEPLDGEIVSPEEIDLLIVPGMSFGKEYGERLGMGGGFYDRYLAQYDGPKIGITFESLLLEEVPVFEWDETVDMIITEKMIRKFS